MDNRFAPLVDSFVTESHNMAIPAKEVVKGKSSVDKNRTKTVKPSVVTSASDSSSSMSVFKKRAEIQDKKQNLDGKYDIGFLFLTAKKQKIE